MKSVVKVLNKIVLRSKVMKILLTAVNAKYIHSNLAVYSLLAYAGAFKEHVKLAEYTINQQKDEILKGIFKEKPDVVCFSCYIWNISFVKELISDLHKIMPETPIWVGGPEVSYDAGNFLEAMPEVTGVLCQEGEETFLELTKYYVNLKETSLKDIDGLVYRDEAGIHENPLRPIMNMDKLVFPYDDMELFAHKIIYYESSRGCPFSCSYCLSSIDKKLRFRSLSLVLPELQFFLDHKVPQVKFVDRTFNCKKEHAMAIWTYLRDHDNGVTNFHFEIAADLMTEEEMNLIATMRPGLIQLEIGVQSTNEETIHEIRRKMDFEDVKRKVKCIQSVGNVHQHLDLIAGLPFEDLGRFRRSFNDVYALYPEQLQLGFLKVLKGSYMHEMVKEYGCVYKAKEPYEVLGTNWLSYEDILLLKGVEEMVEVYYNSGQFAATIRVLESYFKDAFSMYEELAAFYEQKGYFSISHTRIRRYEILMEFMEEKSCMDMEFLKAMLVYDLYLRENMKTRPAWAKDLALNKKERAEFYKEEKQRSKMLHLEFFDFDVKNRSGEKKKQVLLFDYSKRDPLTHNAWVAEITEG